MHKERLQAKGVMGADVSVHKGQTEDAEIHGVYSATLIGADGKVKWEESFDNLVTTVGKNLALDTILSGSGYTVVGPYMGLINDGASAATVSQTMISHGLWFEVGGATAPLYSGNRKTLAWSAATAGSKTTSAAASFSITSAGAIGGCFLVFGAGAVATKDDTNGVLYSAGAFTTGTKNVEPGDTLNVTYTASL